MLALSNIRAGRIAGSLAVALALTSAAILASFPDAFAHDVTVGELTLDGAWTRATPAGADVAGGYLVIKNRGAAPDRLIGGTAAFADHVEIHEMVMEGDVMKMHPVAGGLEVPAGGEAVLKPGSYHVMFIGLKHGLVEGTEEAGTLTFEKAGSIDVEWAVEAIGAKGHGDMGGMDATQ